MSKQVRDVTDIIDLEYLQTVQDSLGKIMGITTALLNPVGVPISRATNLHAFCAMMQATDSGIQLCMVTNGKLIEMNKETKKTAVLTCPNSGLKTAAIPIFLEEEYLGSWLIGQIRMDDVDTELIEATAEKAGLSKEEAKHNMEILPVISEVEFENILNFLETTTKTMTDMVKINADLQTHIAKRKVEAEQMRYLAYHDQYLRVPNGVKLQEDIRQDAYMICFEIAGMRDINNVYGRGAGDQLLKCIADWISGIDGASLYRIKGNDFVLLLKDSSEKGAMDLAASIYERFETAWVVDSGGIDQNIYTGVHIGVNKVDEVPDSYAALLNMVERVLSTAVKEEKPIFFDAEANAEFQESMKRRVSLKACVLNQMEGFSLNYQPVVNAETGKWKGMEALCRWNSPDVGSIRPDIFITEAEQSGLISMISDWVFEEAISQVKAWGLDIVEDFHLSVNLSAIQLRDRTLVERVKDLLEKYQYPAGKLSLEITETAEVQFNTRTIKILNDLRNAGISLALDDFGIGYATFANLKNLPVNMLKIDRSFVNGIEEDEFLQQTMRIMVEYAHAAGLQVTTEGVETDVQHEIIASKGANYIQGYYFSRPLTKEQLREQVHKYKE